MRFSSSTYRNIELHNNKKTNWEIIALVSSALTLLIFSFVLLLGGNPHLGIPLLSSAIWFLVIAKWKSRRPFENNQGWSSDRAQARRRARILAAFFGSISAIFIVMFSWVNFHELPRLLGPHYEGLVVGLDSSHPSPIGGVFDAPIIRFRDAHGIEHTFSNYGVYTPPTKPGENSAVYSIGEKVQVAKVGGKYIALRRNEWFVYVLLAAASGFMAFVPGLFAIQALRGLKNAEQPRMENR